MSKNFLSFDSRHGGSRRDGRGEPAAGRHVGDVDIAPLDGLTLDGHGTSPSMIVDDLDVPSFALAPSKANPPLLVDPNAVLALLWLAVGSAVAAVGWRRR
jgi:hypothetical protein